jgi:hypothetical protein
MDSIPSNDWPRARLSRDGLPHFIDRHLYTSGCGSIYRSRMSHLTVPHPSEHGREYGFVRYEPRETRTGYLIYRADINGSDALPVVTDGKNPETIDAVHRDCRFEGFVECRRGCV